MSAIISSDTDLSTALAAFAQRHAPSPGPPPPLLVDGGLTVGKAHHLHPLARQICCSGHYRPFVPTSPDGMALPCTCRACSLLDAGDSHDYAVLSGREAIGDLRERVDDIIQHRPVQLPYRVLLFRRLDRYRAEAADTLLHLIEEPPEHVVILATARNADRLPATLQGRFQILRHRALDPTSVRRIAATSPALRTASSLAGSYPFQSIGHVALAAGLRFEHRFSEFFLSADFVGLEKRVQAFLREAEGDESHTQAEILEFFTQWMVWRIEEHCAVGVKTQPHYDRVRAHLPNLIQINQSTVATYSHMANPRAYITPSAQFYALISSLNLLRRSAVPTC